MQLIKDVFNKGVLIHCNGLTFTIKIIVSSQQTRHVTLIKLTISKSVCQTLNSSLAYEITCNAPLTKLPMSKDNS